MWLATEFRRLSCSARLLLLSVIDMAINKVSNVIVAAGYRAEDDASPKRGFFESKLRGLSKFVDQNALALQWKVRVMEFDDSSPVRSTVIVQCIVGLLAFALAKKVGQATMK